MKEKNTAILIGAAFITAVISFILSSTIFKVPANRNTKVPSAGTINSTFPDIRHDPNYNTIFNTNALDPAVPLNSNNAPNNQPFNGNSQ